MARPTTVKGLCRATGAAFVDFLLPCTFCSRFLTNLEKCLFDAWPLQLQWKDGCVFGCCQKCIRQCGYLERTCYFQRQLSETEVQNLEGQLTESLVRCQGCLKTLQLPEKKVCCAAKDLNVIRGQVRGYCDLCRLAVL